MKVVVFDEAENELFEFCSYYDQLREGLGDKFLHEFLESIGRIEQFPRRYAVYRGIYRLCPLHRFNVGIYYHLSGNIYIDALIDLRRSARYVRRRLRS